MLMNNNGVNTMIGRPIVIAGRTFLSDNGCIPEIEVRDVLGYDLFKDFKKWIVGQTYTSSGYYVRDVQNFLNR